MPTIAWEERFSVNVDKIDRQHQHLFRLFNQLQEAIIAKQGQEALALIVDEMVDYTLTHFATEEKYMLAYDYPELADHKAEHEVFTGKALELQSRIRNDEFILSLEVLRFLSDWIAEHICTSDQRYSRHFNAAGLR
ncbi:bacteriohemerythrin [Geoalkalibacter halelectricus]|uniref:Bacteriohemerythrin n=1 Tax=Geoalkalibacter halelectricus TaxID=2847045 RepID=A0ABY5ZPV2_9BACT|nr:bacteriohemerythrin [Geoalkalibacter halelectricus]MDO3378720.1 bacteriohemerythrin [Geoalkalibacter halelectricus]UWZ79972.1 bacteriohemerythrin [Geoalkalibacter halelectricus]